MTRAWCHFLLWRALVSLHVARIPTWECLNHCVCSFGLFVSFFLCVVCAGVCLLPRFMVTGVVQVPGGCIYQAADSRSGIPAQPVILLAGLWQLKVWVCWQLFAVLLAGFRQRPGAVVAVLCSVGTVVFARPSRGWCDCSHSHAGSLHRFDGAHSFTALHQVGGVVVVGFGHCAGLLFEAIVAVIGLVVIGPWQQLFFFCTNARASAVATVK